LDSVIIESLRLYPPVALVKRGVGQDYVLGNTVVQVKKGQIIHFPTYAIHRFPENFPEPNSFKPERFFPENRSHHSCVYLPFGGRPSNCVGMRLAVLEVKLTLIHSVYRFKFSSTSKTLVNLYSWFENLSIIVIISYYAINIIFSNSIDSTQMLFRY
jgi:cytochrome P450